MLDGMDDVTRLVRARFLLAATLDDHRAIVGRVSRAWIKSETERRIPVGPALAPLVGSMSPAHPSSEPRTSRVNSNRLPKLEPQINAYVLAGSILYGARLYGAGSSDPARGVGFREIENDLIIASLIHATLGQQDRFSAYLPEARRIVDEAWIGERFGSGVLAHLEALKGHLAHFEDALASPEATNKPVPSIPIAYANAIAALMAAELRLTARAAGDGIFGTLDAAKRSELERRGIDPGEPGAAFPERPYLARAYTLARAAAALPGVDPSTIRMPVEDQLLRNVRYVLDDAVPPSHLVGPYGAAVHQFHTVLPIMYRFSPIIRRVTVTAEGASEDASHEVEGPYALGTLHLTGLEVTRYLHNARRKGFGSAAGHSFAVSARADSVLHGHRCVPILAGCDCHDVVEDGGMEVVGYDQSLELFARRFGAPLAALVAEVTDSITRSDGPAKAAAFLNQPVLLLPDELYNVGQFEELRAVATNPEVPYTLAGAVIKLADTGTTQEEGLLDPDLMEGVWRHSGARVHWDLYSKGRILQPIWERLVAEIRLSEIPFYRRRPGALPAATIERLQALVAWSMELADLYAVQNLAILAGEHGLDQAQRSALIGAFFSGNEDDPAFAARLDAALDDARLDPELRRRGWAATFRLTPDGRAERDLDKLVAYRNAASWRQAQRVEIGIAPTAADRIGSVLRLLDLATEGMPEG